MNGEPLFEVTTIPFRELPLSNDFLFGEVMRKPEICGLFLEALLGKPIARVEYVLKQKDISDTRNPAGRLPERRGRHGLQHRDGGPRDGRASEEVALLSGND